MQVSQPVIIAGAIVVVLAAAFLLIANTPGKYDDFAQCLSDKGAKMYGAYWCPHCKEQKEAFGNSWKYVNYIECSESDGSQTQECAAAGIKGYPTWEFADGSRESGLMTFNELSAKTGCPLEAG